MPRLIFLSNGSIGDGLMILAYIANVKVVSPEVRASIVVGRSEGLFKELAAAEPAVEIVLTKKRIEFFRWLSRRLFQKNIVIIPPPFGSVPNSLKLLGYSLTRMPGSVFVGFPDKGQLNNLYGKKLQFNLQTIFYNNIEAAGRAAGLTAALQPPRFVFSPAADALARYNLQPHNYIVIQPFAANAKRSLPPQRWHDLFVFISHTFPHLKLVISGGFQDEQKARDLIQSTPATIVCGVPISVIATLISQAALYIGVDTGISHLASLIGQKSLIIGNRSNPTWLPTYSSTSKILINPKNCTCQGDKTGDCTVYENDLPYFRCLYDIPQSEIEQSIQTMLN